MITLRENERAFFRRSGKLISSEQFPRLWRPLALPRKETNSMVHSFYSQLNRALHIFNGFSFDQDSIII